MRQRGTIVLRQDRAEDVSLVTLGFPPANLLVPQVCTALVNAITAAEADAEVRAIVLISAFGDFSQGDALSDPDPLALAVAQAALCQRVEDCAKPVVVAIRGAAIGAGAELALAAHGRVASESAALSFPAVTLGLVPGAGGGQRLTRLIGAEQALRLLLSGQPAPAVEALALGMLDRVVEGDPLPAALELARALAEHPPRRTSDRREGLRDARAHQTAVAAARAALAHGPVTAAARMIDCVEAALLLPAPAALAFETAQHADLAVTPASAGLRHAALAEGRAAPPIAALSEEDEGPDRLAIWGASEQAPDIAFAALRSGMKVHLADPRREALVTALERIAVMQETALRQGRLSQAALDEEWSRLLPTLDPPRLPDCDIALLTASGAPPAPPAAAVLSLISPLAEGAMRLSRAGDLAEIAVTEAVAPARSAQAMAFARRLGWRAVLTHTDGEDSPPVATQLARALAETVSHLEQAGVARPDIARALAAHGITGEGTTHRPSREDAVIARRCIAAMANVGARLLEQGVLRKPCEVDLAAIGAGLMARHSGGPMYQADQRGMLILVRDLRQWAVENPALWAPAPLIEKLWSDGARFATLDAAPPVQAAQSRRARRWRRA